MFAAMRGNCLEPRNERGKRRHRRRRRVRRHHAVERVDRREDVHDHFRDRLAQRRGGLATLFGITPDARVRTRIVFLGQRIVGCGKLAERGAQPDKPNLAAYAALLFVGVVECL